jgi:hypothetical protein
MLQEVINSSLKLLRDFLKSYLIELFITCIVMILLYHRDINALGVGIAIFSVVIIPVNSILLVLLHRLFLVRKQIHFSIRLIAIVYAFWISIFYLVFIPVESYLSKYNFLYLRKEFKIGSIWLFDGYTLVAYIVTIIAIMIFYTNYQTNKTTYGKE